MGRVYNALVKAGTLSEHGRPKARPFRAPHARPGRRTVWPESKPVEAKPVEAKPVEAKPVEARPVDAMPFGEATWAETFGQVSSARAAAVAVDLIAVASATALGFAPAPASVPAVVESPSTIALDDPVEKCGAITISERSLDPHLAALVGDDVLARERYN